MNGGHIRPFAKAACSAGFGTARNNGASAMLLLGMAALLVLAAPAPADAARRKGAVVPQCTCVCTENFSTAGGGPPKRVNVTFARPAGESCGAIGANATDCRVNKNGTYVLGTLSKCDDAKDSSASRATGDVPPVNDPSTPWTTHQIVPAPLTQ